MAVKIKINKKQNELEEGVLDFITSLYNSFKNILPNLDSVKKLVTILKEKIPNFDFNFLIKNASAIAQTVSQLKNAKAQNMNEFRKVGGKIRPRNPATFNLFIKQNAIIVGIALLVYRMGQISSGEAVDASSVLEIVELIKRGGNITAQEAIELIPSLLGEGADDATPIMGKVDTRPRIDISNQLEKEKAAKQLAKELEKFISDFDTTLGFAEFQAIKSVSGSNLRILSNLNAAIQEINNLKTLESETDPEFFLFEIEKIFDLEKWKNRKSNMSEAYGETEEDIETQKQKLLITIPGLIEKAQFLSNFVKDDIDTKFSSPSATRDTKTSEPNPFKRIVSSLKAVELAIKDSQGLKSYGKKLEERKTSVKIKIKKQEISEEAPQLPQAVASIQDIKEKGCKWDLSSPNAKVFFDVTGFNSEMQNFFGKAIIAGNVLAGALQGKFKGTATAANHAGFIFSDGSIFHTTSDKKGVQFQSNYQDILKEPQIHLVVEIPTVKETKLKAVCLKMYNEVEAAKKDPEKSSYDMKGIIRQIPIIGNKVFSNLGAGETDNYSWYCSELVANILVRSGVINYEQLKSRDASVQPKKQKKLSPAQRREKAIDKELAKAGLEEAILGKTTGLDKADEISPSELYAMLAPISNVVPVTCEKNSPQNVSESHLNSTIKEALKEVLIFEQELGYDTAILEDGTPVCEACLYETMTCGCPDTLEEAKYQGRSVPLGKPMRGDVKKFKVYVRDPSTGNIKKVNFGDPNMKIKKSNPARRKSFRARHNCDNPGPRTKARYWSCRKW